MAHLVKPKIYILSISILAFILIIALQKSFFRTPTIKRWDAKEQLSWEDFKGIPVPFSKYGAVIQSEVYIEYDSLRNKYMAYAGQNNMLSWSMLKDDYALEHEQYHFNITELHARKLNKYFSEKKKISQEEAERKLNETNHDLYLHQRRYDFETDHSLKSTKQNYWVFKVDSSLQEYSLTKGITTDQLSGISAQFAKSPQFLSGKNSNGLAYRGYGLDGYQMSFAFVSFKYSEITYENFEEYCKFFIHTDSSEVVENSFRQIDDFLIYDSNKINTSNTQEIWDRVYKYGDDLFLIRVEAPYDSINIEYEQIKNSFFKSISFSDTKDYWIKKANEDGDHLTFTHSGTKRSNEGGGDNYTSLCLLEAENIFLKPPFTDEAKNLYLAFDIVADSEDSVLNNIALINREEVFEWEVDSTEQFLVLPDSVLPNGAFELEFGYVLKKDSLNPCYQFYKKSEFIDLL